MVKFQTPLQQTVTLVERRVKDNRSEDPIRDLAFLSEHYRSKHEWDKASAATRHMLAVAEGSTSVFEITPVDIELQESKQHLRRRFRSRFLLTLTMLLAVAGCTSFAASQFEIDQKFLLDVKTQVFPFDPQNFVDRASFFDNKNKFKEALADCDKALTLDAKNSGALQLKSYVLFEMGALELAWQNNELSSHTSASYFYNRRRIEEARGDFAAAAISEVNADAIAPSPSNKMSIGYEYARSGDSVNALRFAELATTTAQTDYYRVWGFMNQARYNLRLSRYREAILAASKAIEHENNYRLSQPVSDAYAFRAEAEYQLAMNEDAVADASKAIGFDYTNFRAYTVRAKIFQRMGRTDDAKADLRSADTWRNWRDM